MRRQNKSFALHSKSLWRTHSLGHGFCTYLIEREKEKSNEDELKEECKKISASKKTEKLFDWGGERKKREREW